MIFRILMIISRRRRFWGALTLLFQVRIWFRRRQVSRAFDNGSSPKAAITFKPFVRASTPDRIL